MDERPRILIVDDIPSNLKVLGQALREDYQISVATRGSEALRLAESAQRPDLILLDIMMPEMDGYEVCQTLKSSAATRDIPVIFLTARDEVADEEQGLMAGAVDYITKPFSMAIVRARVRTHVELKRHRDRLEQLSSRDGLTQIPNRRRFDEILDVEWRRARRAGTVLSLIMADIDHFKAYNDRLGHVAGDDCIRRVAAALATCSRRAADFVARYGGEEFVMLLPHTKQSGALFVAERARRAVEELAIEHPGSPSCRWVTISLGVASQVPGQGMVPAALVQRADHALYLAKGSGRNKVAVEPASASEEDPAA